MFQIGRNTCTVDRSFGLVGLETFECVRVKELCRGVFGGGDEHGSVFTGLHVEDVTVMILGSGYNLIRLLGQK
jgi:hypothetical protein